MPDMDELLRQRVARDTRQTSTPPFERLRTQAKRRRQRRAAALAAAVAAVVGLVTVGVVALTSANRSSSQPPATPPSAEFPLPGVLPVIGHEALVEGVLRFTDANCPYVEQPEGTVVLNFAAGTASGQRTADGTRTVIGADGALWGREGERVSFGGGGPEDRDKFVDCGAPTNGDSIEFVVERPTKRTPGQ